MKKPQSTRQTLNWFWHFTKPDKHIFWSSTFLVSMAIIVQDILPPLVISKAFNKLQTLYVARQPIHFSALSQYVWLYITLLLVGLVLWRIQAICAWLFEIRAKQRIAEHIFDHLQHQSAAFHANHFGGSLVSDTNRFMGGYERLMDDFTWGIMSGITALLASLIVLSTVSWQYAVGLLIMCSLYMTIMGRRILRQVSYDRTLAATESERTGILADNITNVAAVRAFAGEASENKLFHKYTQKTKTADFSLMRVAMRNEATSHAITASTNITAFVGGLLVVSRLHAPVGVLFLAINYTMSLSRRLWESGRTIRNVNRALGDATNMTKILGLESDMKVTHSPTAFVPASGAVTFEHVNFAYSDSQNTNVFSGLNFSIKPGEKIGLVGPSGGGKTTITKLLMRQMDIQSGRILIDEQNIADVTLTSLRSSITSVPQEPMLFHRTIAENIAYGKPDATQDEITAVAKLAHAHDFINSLPHGYNTLVGERGVKLSGGQRQRVAIARAMLKDAPLLLLDEATSALDSESERLIQDALWKLMEGRTAIVIAHRLSTIHHMDRIIVVDQGTIVGNGTHAELLGEKGLYARLWSHQSGGFIED